MAGRWQARTVDRLGEEPPVTQGSDSEHREPQSHQYARRRSDQRQQPQASLEEVIRELAVGWLETRAALDRLDAILAKGIEAAAREEAQAAVQVRPSRERWPLPEETQEPPERA